MLSFFQEAVAANMAGLSSRPLVRDQRLHDQRAGVIAACVDQIDDQRLAAEPCQPDGIAAGVDESVVAHRAPDRGLARAKRRLFILYGDDLRRRRPARCRSRQDCRRDHRHA